MLPAAVVLPLMLGASPPAGLPAPPRNAAAFTEADCRRSNGRPVYFVGEVVERDGVGDLYYLILRGDGFNGRQWHALVSREDWLAVEEGRQVVVSGELLLYTDSGDRYAVIRGAALAK